MKIQVRTRCEATVEEVWTLDVTPEQLADIEEDPAVALDLLDSEQVVSVVNDNIDNEQDREVLSVVEA